MTIYLSGRITGNPNYVQDFERAERQINFLHCEVVNPVKVSPYDENKSWSDYMKDDLKAMLDCDAIYMLKGWKRSKGARLERKLARRLNITVFYER